MRLKKNHSAPSKFLHSLLVVLHILNGLVTFTSHPENAAQGGRAVYGIMFSQLKRFVDETLAPVAWDDLFHEARLQPTTYLITESYPDSDLVALVEAGARLAERPQADLLRELGAFVAPRLIQMYQSLIDPEWDAMDLIEHTQKNIHRVISFRDPQATPPYIECTRAGPDSVTIEYSSPRRLCHLAEGIVMGIGRHYGDRLSLRHVQCMHENASKCVIVVDRGETDLTGGNRSD